MRRVLLVDDEPRVLEGLGRQLRPLRRRWQVEMVSDGQTALESVAAAPPEVIISDMMMPGMDGAELLSRVREDHPEVIRMVLSGHMGEGSILRAVSVAHRTLTKPCPADCLRGILEQVDRLCQLVPREAACRALSSLDTQPMPAQTLARVRQAPDGEAALSTLRDLALGDPTLAATMLHLANLDALGCREPTLSVERAVERVGPSALIRLCDEHDFFRLAEDPPPADPRPARIARLAREIAGPEHGPIAHAAALLEDFGIQLFARLHPDRYRSLLQRCEDDPTRCPRRQRETLGCTAPELAAYLLGIWGLPARLVSAIEHHREPTRCAGEMDPVLAAVHAATAVVDEAMGPAEGSCAPLALDPTIAQQLGASENRERWRRLLNETVEGDRHVQASIP